MKTAINGTIVVLGAAGGVGSGIVEAALAAGHPVIAVGRSAEKLAALYKRMNEHSRLSLLVGSVDSEATANALAQDLRNLRQRLAGVVACLNAPRQGGRLLERSAESLDRHLHDNVVSHFIAAKLLIPVLAESAPGGAYLFVGGPAEFPWAGYGHVSVANAALKMLVQVIRDEAKDVPVRVHQLQIGSIVKTYLSDNCCCPTWISAVDVGRQAVALIRSTDAVGTIVGMKSGADVGRLPPAS